MFTDNKCLRDPDSKHLNLTLPYPLWVDLTHWMRTPFLNHQSYFLDKLHNIIRTSQVRMC